ncbi:MAG: tRNA (adenosine(37)-N6)-threonylcarbamoyltransferase complex dimerization subunit type 1 TsaB, partial [Oscillospiraceae bacterium]|nr:tRNA (adenosine(37)-N6)-threonylcarbamoyltransferase complex dimerization subunit type 1 TsaB [Oscillospiraceae bacterium]
MIILGVDSSSAAGSAAVSRDGELLYEAFANEGLTHSQTLLVRCDEALRAGGVRPSDVDVFAVTSGPGSFTGL